MNKNNRGMCSKIARGIVGKCVNLDGKVVHHIDGNQENNSPGNLIAVTRKDHRKLHVTLGGFKKQPHRSQKITYRQIDSLISLYNQGIWV